ncbi:MAG: polyprenyl synthetase family protein [Verrucomicrobiales bacterium]
MPTVAAKKKLAFPFELIRADLSRVEDEIREQARAFDPAVEGYVSYVCNTSGKRIRPALALLAGGACGGSNPDHRKLGTVLELIHIATLVHDDIMDGASVRRGMPTASAKWGNALSVLLGDCLFAHALTLTSEFEDRAISRKISQAAADVCQGEIIQTQRRFDLSLKVDEYLRIISMKTAALFASATELGARLSGASEEVQAGMREFGDALGTAYQIYDDCLDLVGDEAVVGKTLGTDLAKGKLTLPVLNLINRATDSQRAKINRMLLEKEPIELPVLAGIADYEGAIDAAVDFARDLLVGARKNLLPLGGNDFAEGLDRVVGYLDDLLVGCRR